jgi:hypothetical protein
MFIASLALALLASAESARPTTDTTFAIRPGTRVVVENHAGQIRVDTWNRSEIRVVAQHKRRAHVVFDPSPGRLEITAEGSMGEPVWVDYQITVPAETPLELSGIDTDIEVEGARAEIKAESVQGDVIVHGGEGPVTASSVEGAVEVVGPRGRVEASSVNRSARVVGARGDVQASAISGDVYLEDLVFFVGSYKANGSYSFSTHDGDLMIGVPEKASVSGSVATFQGDFASAFPVETNERRRGKQIHFTLGDGSARLEIEAFNGDVRLDRPEAVAKAMAAARAESSDERRSERMDKQIDKQVEESVKKSTKHMSEYDKKHQKEMEKHTKEQDKDSDEDDGDKEP